MNPSLDLAEFRAGYLAEVDEHLASASRNLMAVEANVARGQASPRPVRELFRSLHTIKGLSAMVGVEPVVELAHAMETLLRAADEAGGRLEERSLDVLVKGIQAVEQRVRAVADNAPVAAAPPALLEALGQFAPPAAVVVSRPPAQALPPELQGKLSASEQAQLEAVPPGKRAVRVQFVPSPERAAAGHTISSARQRLEQLAELVKVLPLARPQGPDAPGGLIFAILAITDADDAALASAVGDGPQAVTTLSTGVAEAAVPLPPPPEALEESLVDDAGTRRGVVRVDVERLDDALDKLSALVVTRFRMERAVQALAGRGVDVRELGSILQENGRELRDLRHAIMRARMVSATEMLERVPLLVRGLVRVTGKPTRLHIDAGRAELDKGVAERVFPAIVHLVRNAIDHAIETPEERTRAGKPGEGTLRVTCFERSNNQLELSVSDDGRGIDAEKVARRAGRPVPTTDEELLALITLPGLSTREEATTTSGRGLGMDIVRRVIAEELGGELALRTTPGQGTTFIMRIPLTITIVDAFSFRCGDQPFVVPVAGVEEIVDVEAASIVSAPRPGARGQIRLLERRGAAMPLVSLTDVFALQQPPVPARKAIVVRRNGQPFAFQVDQMLGQQEVVVRPLEDPLVRSPGVTGATDLGDGRPTLVLDLVALCGRVGRVTEEIRS